MGKIETYKDLIAWQKGMDFVEEIYIVTRLLPADERFGLTSQLRRAAVSIPSNIAEGFGRSGRGDFVKFLDIALGSCNESETQLLVCCRLHFLEAPDASKALALVNEVQKIIKGLISSLQAKNNSSLRDK